MVHNRVTTGVFHCGWKGRCVAMLKSKWKNCHITSFPGRSLSENRDLISINSNQLMQISVFIKNTLKVYLKFLLPRHVSDHRGIHPQGAIIRS